MIKRIRYMLEALLMRCAVYVLGILPIDTASNIGGWLGRMIGPWFTVTRKVGYRNLERIFPELTYEQKHKIIEGMWDNLGRTAAEFPHLATIGHDDLMSRVTIDGLENFEEAKRRSQEGTSVLFFSGHIANWEILPKVTAELGLPLFLVYRHANNPVSDQIIQDVRSHYQVEGISKSQGVGIRGVLKAVKAGKPIGMLLDQKASEGISLPFLGHDALTAPAIATIAKKYDVLLLPIQLIRCQNQARFNIKVGSPLSFYHADGETTESILTKVNHMIGTWIKEHPSQWFWVHKRWG